VDGEQRQLDSSFTRGPSGSGGTHDKSPWYESDYYGIFGDVSRRARWKPGALFHVVLRALN
jgi:hypothetical protein